MDQYGNKLIAFNSTKKYQEELDFLFELLGDNYNKVLDYGCGNLYAVEQFNNRKKEKFFGYDIRDYYFTGEYADKLGQYDIVYFMHSLAHIENTKFILEQLRTKTVIAITPNKEWLDLQDKSNYKPDTTVIEHFNLMKLEELFVSAGYVIEISGQFGKEVLNEKERLFIRANKI